MISVNVPELRKHYFSNVECIYWTRPQSLLQLMHRQWTAINSDLELAYFFSSSTLNHIGPDLQSKNFKTELLYPFNAKYI